MTTTTSATRPVRAVISGRPGELGVQQQALQPLIDGARVPQARIGVAEVSMLGEHRSLPHRHDRTPMIVYVLDGQAVTHHGRGMVALPHGPEHMVYVPAGLEHAASNQAPRQLIALEARLLAPGGDFNSDTTPLPELRPALDQATHFPGVASSRAGRSEPILVRAQGDRPGYGLVPIVHRGTVLNATLSSARLHLAPPEGPGQHTVAGQLHRREQRVLAVLSGTVALIYGESVTPDTITLSRNDVVWLPENTPYLLANIGSTHATGIMFSTDPDFDGDREPVPELDEPAAAAIADVRRH
ncbi:hypothetical protein [Amycolatopsis magusensis]|uniref:hypothetical protein n=1 Tax=Amycolatopsis magusensis TaxID=882444 RepID=UPI0037B70A0C